MKIYTASYYDREGTGDYYVIGTYDTLEAAKDVLRRELDILVDAELEDEEDPDPIPLPDFAESYTDTWETVCENTGVELRINAFELNE